MISRNGLIIVVNLLFWSSIYITVLSPEVGKVKTVAYSEIHGPLYVMECGAFTCLSYECQNCPRVDISLEGNSDYIIDYSVYNMLGGMGFLNESILSGGGNILIVGIRGGTLASYVQKHYSHFNIDLVERDETTYDVAKSYFGLWPDDYSVHITDSYEKWFGSMESGKYDIIWINDNAQGDMFTPEMVGLVRSLLKSSSPSLAVYHNPADDFIVDSELHYAQNIALWGTINEKNPPSTKVSFLLTYSEPKIDTQDNFIKQMQSLDSYLGNNTHNMPFSKGTLIYSQLVIL